jgi:hypothetical protein
MFTPRGSNQELRTEERSAKHFRQLAAGDDPGRRELFCRVSI